ncbi:MAG: hypothetical protein MR727_00235 [Lentisphaeria bacterium]|nr:hypothetical protein [Lentisphaeria bacterium]
MGGCGTFAFGNSVAYSYETVGMIDDVKILRGIEGSGKHGLPEESHNSAAYIKLNSDGSFNMMRIYDTDHYLMLEIAYHREPELDPQSPKVLHVHEYKVKGNMQNRPKRLLTEDEYEKYKKYFGGKLK